MPHLIVAMEARRGIDRCNRFLIERNPVAARRSADVIKRALRVLESHPAAGRPVAGQPELRELVISFGSAGYLALYRHVPDEDIIVVLAFRHQREGGY